MVGNELLFAQRGGERLRALSFRYEVDGLVSPELSAIAPHIPSEHGGFKEIAYQQTPDSTVWMVLNDGKVGSITLNRDQEMNAWALHDFGGKAISVCTLPTTSGADQCFMLIQRGIHIFIEEVLHEAMSDCEIEYSNAMDANVVGSLTNPHLNWRNDDGYFYQDSDFSLDDQPKWYGQPFEVEVSLLPPDFSQVPSTAMFHKIMVHSVVLWLKDSIGGYVSGRELKHKKINQSAFQNLPFTGYVEESLSGWCALHELDLKITHNKPMPFHVQSISMLVSMNEK